MEQITEGVNLSDKVAIIMRATSGIGINTTKALALNHHA
jgi:NAD(P)-dependent dehydrogenase (short-subunit alcohol dehydrogenase family)